MNLVACSRSMVLYPAKLSLLAALPRASALEITLRCTSSCRFWSSVCMPMLRPVWIAEYICAILFSRMRLRIAGVPIMISCAAQRPVPSLVFSSVCEITHLAHQDHVRILAQRASKGVGEGQGMRPDLALVDEAFLRLVHELDGILDGEDVAVLGLVLVVDHRRKRGRLARAGRPGDQHDAAGLVGDFLEDLRALQVLERQDLRRDGPHHGGGAAVLHKRIYPDARQVR